MRPAKLVLFFLVLCSGFGLLQGCSPEKPETQTLRVGTVRWTGVLPLYYAQANGWFEKEKLDLKLITFGTIGDAQRAMQRGRIDVLISSTWSLMQLPQQDRHYSAFLIIGRSRGADGIVAKQGIHSIQDLQHKRLAIQRGTTGEYYWALAALSAGIGINDIVRIESSAPVMRELMMADGADAAILLDPYLSDLRQTIKGNLLFSTADIESPIWSVAAADQQFVKQHSDQLQTFAQIWFRSVENWRNQPDTFFTRMSEISGDAPTKLRHEMARVEFANIEKNRQLLQQPQKLIDVVPFMKSLFGHRAIAVPEFDAVVVNNVHSELAQ